MPFSDKQLLAVAEVISGQFFEGTPRPISDVMGLDPASEMATSYDTKQEFNQPKKDLHLAGIHRDLFETQLLHALKQGIAIPELYENNFGRTDFYLSEKTLSGFVVLTDSRGGCTPLLRSLLNKFNIPNDYGDLPSISVSCYNDGYVVFEDRLKKDIQVVPYEGFKPQYQWIQKAEEFSQWEKIEVFSPKPYLFKNSHVGHKFFDVQDGQISLTEFSEIVEGWQTVFLSPEDYAGDINIDDIDSNDPQKIIGIKRRWFGNMLECFPSTMHDTMEAAGHLYAKPVELIKVPFPIVCGERNRRIYVEAGDYASYSRGFAGVGDLIFRKHTQLEIDQLLEGGELILCEGPETIVRTLQGHKNAKINHTPK